ncbi:glycosyltransferase family 29 protein [Paracoccus sp. p3-h83]|uniref:glycosyltransferase family 29 protein n=1 Tax=Paracoccus sp. p3-h83 TaxID=3342805 RepID=UPI0035B6F228
MTPLRFYIARVMRNEALLASLSVPQADLLADLAGRSVALVGNARALADGDHGAAIDRHDLVIRINRAPMPLAHSHGSRTDWLALATSLRPEDRDRLGKPRILWMSPKRKRLARRDAHSPGFYLHPLADYNRLHDLLRAPPTTGAMMIDLLARSDLDHLTLFGFDFFTSLSLSGRRRADQVPHDFRAEAGFVQGLMRHDPRIDLIR